MSLWRFEVSPRLGQTDPAGDQTLQTLADFGVNSVKTVHTSRLFLIELPGAAATTENTVRQIADDLLTDPVVEQCNITPAGAEIAEIPDALAVEVHFKPGVMDNVANSTRLALADMGIAVESVRTASRFNLQPIPIDQDLAKIPRLLGNDCIQDVVIGTRPVDHAPTPPQEPAGLRHVPIRGLDGEGLANLSRDGHLFLSLDEMRAIQRFFVAQERDPTDLELETLAQTWSEHCVHKTLKSRVTYTGPTFPGRGSGDVVTIHFENLLKDTIVRATEELAAEGRGPECLSVFVDNAGIIAFDNAYGIAFKVETHNHPSAIEPYGGSATGVGGVIRDILGCGLGARPIANTDVFCVAPPDWPIDAVPRGIIHPKTILKGVVSGVRDYGNRMGIPTVNGAVQFDPRYLGNPLVYCGCVGLIPRRRIDKAARPGDAVVLLGGRTGRDGIHGATFSSAELTTSHEDEFAHAVQIGNPIEEKKVLDIILRAREYPDSEDAAPGTARTGRRCLFSAVTDCGAGGLSSAVGEMAEETGAEVNLEAVPLKYDGLRYDEIWISEAQERMVLAVPPENVETLLSLARSEDVEATVIGRFTDTRGLVIRYKGSLVGELDMVFLHQGVPKTRRTATWSAPLVDAARPSPESSSDESGDDGWIEALRNRLGNPTSASKHWLIHQYDHEVQAGSVVKPLVGAHEAPADAAVLRPRLDSHRGIALGCGMADPARDLDPYWMAVSSIDEAIRNVVCVGGDPSQAAILDNFCWPGAEDAQSMGALVRACQACYDASKAYGIPFISGKDSLNNVFAMGASDVEMLQSVVDQDYPAWSDRFAAQMQRHPGRLSIPYTLLISAMALVDDVNRCITSVPSQQGGRDGAIELYYLGVALTRWEDTDLSALGRLHQYVAGLIAGGEVVAAHDCSEGGLAAAVAEMWFGTTLDVIYCAAATGLLSDPLAVVPSGYVVQPTGNKQPDGVSDIEDMICERVATLTPCANQQTFTFARRSPKGGEPENQALERQSCSLRELLSAWTSPLDW